VGPRAGLDGCGKSRPTGIRSPDHPARSESLYRLSYPGPQVLFVYVLKFFTFSGLWSDLQSTCSACVSPNVDLNARHEMLQASKSILLSYEQKKAIQSSTGTEHLAMIYQNVWSSLETVSRTTYQVTYHLAAGQVKECRQTDQFFFMLPA
jgi:hypothetical protein